MKTENVWFGRNMTDLEMQLCNFMDEHGFLFNDMLFRNGSKTYDLAAVTDENGEADGEAFLPEELTYFSYEWFNAIVDDLEDDTNGYYEHSTQTIAIDTKHLEDPTILHEMIHLHEYVLLEYMPYFRDAVFYELYRSVKDRIPLLDEIIEQHGHLTVMARGFEGLHSILFLLKSFEIDMYHSWKLGTTFGYGQDELYGKYEYIQ